MLDFMLQYWLGLILTTLTSCIVALALMVIGLFGGVRALLRDRIIQAYHHYMEKGCCPIYAHENIERLYKAYRRLRGNGTVTKLVDEIRGLPSVCKEEDDNEN